MTDPKTLAEILADDTEPEPLPCLTGHGGAGRGQGRKRTLPPGSTLVCARLPPDLLEILDSLAAMAGTDRSATIRRLIADAADNSC